MGVHIGVSCVYKLACPKCHAIMTTLLLCSIIQILGVQSLCITIWGIKIPRSVFDVVFFSGLTPFLRRRWRTGVFLYPRAIICKIKWVKVEKIQNDYMIYGMWIAKIDGVKMRTLPHTHFLQTKHFWHHYFKI